jgi:hypothetical protein
MAPPVPRYQTWEWATWDIFEINGMLVSRPLDIFSMLTMSHRIDEALYLDTVSSNNVRSSDQHLINFFFVVESSFGSSAGLTKLRMLGRTCVSSVCTYYPPSSGPPVQP